MDNYREIEGDLISLALAGEFDVITHGCNCMNTMGGGIAPKMTKAFGCHTFLMERLRSMKGDINKLGQIDYQLVTHKNQSHFPPKSLYVVNSYTQYNYGRNHSNGGQKPLDYAALTLCMRKINHIFKGKHIGLPMIGCGLAGGDWNLVKSIILRELKDCKVTVVLYENK